MSNLTPDRTPSAIGPYIPERLIGRGAMAGVYLCRAADGSAVAVKWMDQPHPPLLLRFEREVAALSKLNHPGVVRVLGHGVHQERPYLVMEHIEGIDLRVYAPKLHQRAPAERYARVRTFGRLLAEALAHMHSQSLVHRDVKPSNVLVADDGRVVLTDFGVVKDLEDPDITAAGTVIGTVAFAAPEQMVGERIDPRTDLFGLGATLYYLLTQRRPFEGAEQRAQAAQPPPPSRFDPGIPADLEAVVLRLMAPRPQHRYADARQAAAALAAGRAEGITLAGRQEALDAVARALGRARQGVAVVVRPRGPLGAGKGWLAEMVRYNARRSGIPVYVVVDEGSLRHARGRLLAGEAAVVVSPVDLDPIEGVEQVDIPLEPLGVADVRRTVVGAAPLTKDPAQVADRLHRLSAGIPGLLVPLLSAYTEAGAVRLPEVVPPPSVVDDYFEGLDLDDREIVGLLSLVDEPLSADVLEALLQVPVTGPLSLLAERGVVREVRGRWLMTAELFRTAARAFVADPEGILLRLYDLRAQLGEGGPTEVDALIKAEGEALAGRLGVATELAREAVMVARATGDRPRECAALTVLGQILLDQGAAAEATRILADATALARAAAADDVRRTSHVLRAAASLDANPQDRAAAAAAVDRLLPLLSGAAARGADAIDARLYATWARAALALGDRATYGKAVGEAERRLPGLDPVGRGRVLLALAQAAAAGGEDDRARAWLTAAEGEVGPWPLFLQQARRVRMSLRG
jgi:serine/threonine-protein kinase